ncbi:hypothetical protein [Rhizobium herbae]|uniref:Uncharacterized protein n=1 Tax=Rhizobium herbae TaxID=508661 RepID=A0ABS4ETJ5_9HYPH|nr:hypothetical protein [Rhizobium herbae]MBP1861267.1 hypothetical protein [Rhizobium herbae]
MTIVFTVMIPAAASAQAKLLDGAYGNKEGCIYASTGESSGADFFFLLTDEAITSAASYCTFKGPITKRGSSFSAIIACQEEGMEAETDHDVDINRVDASYTIVFKDRSIWGPLDKCK